jgi:cardiolipin synthase
MEEMFLIDLTQSTELVLDARQRVRAPNQPRRTRSVRTSGAGSAGRAATGVLRIGHVVGASFTNRRVLEPVESRLMITAGGLLLTLSVSFVLFPEGAAYPLAAIGAWLAVTLLVRGYRLHRMKKENTSPTTNSHAGQKSVKNTTSL